MSDDDIKAQSAGTIETRAEWRKSPSDFVKNWMTAVEMAGTEEKNWRDDAEATLKRYRAESDRSKNYNILFANTQTKVPALYNSEPTPDIRRRFGDTDPVGKTVADALERGISVEAELYDFDSCMKAAVMDRELQGRGVSRLRVGMGAQGSKWVACEPVKWDDFRHGPATLWEDVPWIAFRHRLSREELVKLDPTVGAKVELDATVGTNPKKDDNLPDMFKRAVCWEIWDKASGEVIWIAESFRDGPVVVVPDPYRLRRFFPIPRPLYAVHSTSSLVPVCEFVIWKPLADEMDELTRRVSGITKVMKMRGLYDGAYEGALSRLSGMDDGELAPIEEAGRAMQAGGLDKAVWLWPVEQAIKVVEGLYQAREQCKATIYEITGVADILRGQTDPNETLGAQQIKAQWGSLRLQDGQREVQNYARDIYRMVADLLADIWKAPDWQAATGVQLDERAMQLMQSDLQREFSIEIETDSTIRADLSRTQQNVAGFVTGFGTFIESIGPAVQAGMMPAPTAVKLLTAFARSFKLGREAEDALDEWQKFVEQMAQQPKQPDPRAQAEQAKAQAAQEKAKADIAKTQMDAQVSERQSQMDMQASQQEHVQRMREGEQKAAIAAQQSSQKMAEGQQKAAVAGAQQAQKLDAMAAEQQQQQKLQKAAVQYSEGMGERRCKNCVYYLGGACERVSPEGPPTPGIIHPEYWCIVFNSNQEKK